MTWPKKNLHRKKNKNKRKNKMSIIGYKTRGKGKTKNVVNQIIYNECAFFIRRIFL